MRFALAVILQIIFFLTYAQDIAIRKIHELQLDFQPVKLSVDRLGVGYVLGNDKMIKLTEEGYPQTNREINLKEIILVETWNPLRIWIHQKANDINQIVLFDQHLKNAEEPFSPDLSLAIDPILIAPGTNNYTYWILDSDFSLKQVNHLNNTVEAETEKLPIAAGSKISYMKSYQGFIFLIDSSGIILMINRLGKLVRQINTGGTKYFGVLGEDIYFHKDATLIFENIYTESRYEVRLPISPDHVIATDERLLLFREKKLTVFAFQPKK